MDSEQFRERLGARLVLWSTVALVLLGIAALVGAAVAGGDAFRQTAQLLFSSLLPLLGTWVGTVLAFYYTKENFAAASASTMDIVRTVSQRLKTSRVSDYMMRRGNVIAELIPPGKALGDLTIAAVEKRFTTIGANGQRISRLLILDSTDACVAIIHRAVFTEALASGLQDSPPVDPAADTLAKLLSKPYPSPTGTTYEEFVTRTIAFVAEERTLADAKSEMEKVPGCQDVIVTKTGSKAEPLIGWISNIDIGRLSQA
jgi:hypothetical protein